MAAASRLDKQQQLIDELESQFELKEPEQSALFSQYAEDPIGFIENKLGFFLTEQQKQICLSVRDRRETNVQASHGCGKTFLAACLCLWWVLCVGGLCITTAPTKRQVIELLWGEIRKTHGKLDLPGELGQTFLRQSEEARAYGFTANHTNSNAFQGVHHPRLLVIEDEACGISPEIDDGASSCVTGAGNRFLRVGNPIAGGGPFEKACKRRHIRIPAWDHPNVSWAYGVCPDGVYRLHPEVAEAILDENGEVKPDTEWPDWCPRDRIPGAVSISWVEDARAKYGEGSSYWQSRVEGYFPEDSAASVIPRSLFLAARVRYDSNPEHWDNLAAAHRNRYGLDVGDGGDAHGLARWQGPVLYLAKEVPGRGDMEDVTRAAGMAIQAMKEHPGSITVDRGGPGPGALAILKEQGFNATGVHWGEAARDSAQFLNAKAEDFWSLRDALRKGEAAIAPLGEHEEMAMEDLSAVWWEETSTGKTRMEDKAKTRKRLQRSPNVGDAVVIGFRTPPARGIKRSGIQLY